MMKNSELYIGTTKLDFNDTFNVKSQVYDILDDDAGLLLTSFTINIPLTDGNKKKLKFPHKINAVLSAYEDATLYANGSKVISGTLKILSIKTTYLKAIIEGLAWPGELDQIYIDEIWDTGDNHTFSAFYVQGSWLASDPLYRYPLIYFGKLLATAVGGYISNTLSTHDFVPSWSIVKIIQKIISYNKSTVDSNSWLYDTEARKMFLLCPWKKHRDLDAMNETRLEVKVTNMTDNQASFTHTTGTTGEVAFSENYINLDTVTIDEASAWDTTGNYWVVPETGSYRFTAAMAAYSSHDVDGGYSSISRVAVLRISAYHVTTGDAILAQKSVTPSIPFDGATEQIYLDTQYCYLLAGARVYVFAALASQAYNGGATRTVYVRVSSLLTYLQTWSIVSDEKYREYCAINEPQKPGDYLPHITALDFLRYCKKRFGLIIWKDILNNKFYIESYNNFIGDSYLDISNKTDNPKNISSEPIAPKVKKRYLFKYNNPSEDKLYTEYVKKNGDPFEYLVELNNDSCINETETVEDDFFAPVIVNQFACASQLLYYPPAIFTDDSDYVNHWLGQWPAFRAKDWTPRLLRWDGFTAPNGSETCTLYYYDPANNATSNLIDNVPLVNTPEIADLYADFSKRYHFMEQGKLITITIIMTPLEFLKFNTVLNNAENEGFRIAYKVKIDNQYALFYAQSVVFDGSKAKLKLIQKI